MMEYMTSGWSVKDYSKAGLHSTFRLGARLIELPEPANPDEQKLGYCVAIAMTFDEKNLIADIIYTVKMDDGRVLTGNVSNFAIDGRNRHA